MILASAVTAIDINSSTALNYYNDGILEFQSDTDGNAKILGDLNITNSEKIADFSTSQIQMFQPLSLEASGPLSVAGGIDLTDGSSNVIESYSTFYLRTSSGSPSDIVLDPTGEVGITSNASISGNLNMDGNNITNFFGSACPSGESVVDVRADGSYQCLDVTSEVSDVYVNRDGDTMTGDLNMLGNDIFNATNVGVGTDSPQENLDVDGTASVENSGTRLEVNSDGDVVVTLGS